MGFPTPRQLSHFIEGAENGYEDVMTAYGVQYILHSIEYRTLYSSFYFGVAAAIAISYYKLTDSEAIKLVDVVADHICVRTFGLKRGVFRINAEYAANHRALVFGLIASRACYASAERAEIPWESMGPSYLTLVRDEVPDEMRGQIDVPGDLESAGVLCSLLFVAVFDLLRFQCLSEHLGIGVPSWRHYTGHKRTKSRRRPVFPPDPE